MVHITKWLLRLVFGGVGCRLFKLLRGQNLNLNLNPVSNQIGIICLVFVLADAATMFECMKLEFATTCYTREILTGMDFFIFFCVCI